MQKIIQFKKRNFWSNQIDTDKLNEKIAELNKNGWIVRSVATSSTLFGIIVSYTLLIELQE